MCVQAYMGQPFLGLKLMSSPYFLEGPIACLLLGFFLNQEKNCVFQFKMFPYDKCTCWSFCILKVSRTEAEIYKFKLP